MISGTPLTIRIRYFYPRLVTLAGDRGNLFALLHLYAWRGITGGEAGFAGGRSTAWISRSVPSSAS